MSPLSQNEILKAIVDTLEAFDSSLINKLRVFVFGEPTLIKDLRTSCENGTATPQQLIQLISANFPHHMSMLYATLRPLLIKLFDVELAFIDQKTLSYLLSEDNFSGENRDLILNCIQHGSSSWWQACREILHPKNAFWQWPLQLFYRWITGKQELKRSEKIKPPMHIIVASLLETKQQEKKLPSTLSRKQQTDEIINWLDHSQLFQALEEANLLTLSNLKSMIDLRDTLSSDSAKIKRIAPCISTQDDLDIVVRHANIFRGIPMQELPSSTENLSEEQKIEVIEALKRQNRIFNAVQCSLKKKNLPSKMINWLDYSKLFQALEKANLLTEANLQSIIDLRGTLCSNSAKIKRIAPCISTQDDLDIVVQHANIFRGIPMQELPSSTENLSEEQKIEVIEALKRQNHIFNAVQCSLKKQNLPSKMINWLDYSKLFQALEKANLLTEANLKSMIGLRDTLYTDSSEIQAIAPCISTQDDLDIVVQHANIFRSMQIQETVIEELNAQKNLSEDQKTHIIAQLKNQNEQYNHCVNAAIEKALDNGNGVEAVKELVPLLRDLLTSGNPVQPLRSIEITSSLWYSYFKNYFIDNIKQHFQPYISNYTHTKRDKLLNCLDKNSEKAMHSMLQENYIYELLESAKNLVQWNEKDINNLLAKISQNIPDNTDIPVQQAPFEITSPKP